MVCFMKKPTTLFPPEKYCIDDSVGYLLTRTRAKLAKAVDAVLAQHDITSAQGGILMMLSSGNYRTAVELARELYIDSAAMTRMIDRLEKRALLERVRSAEDRRVVNLQLTEEGMRLAQQLPAMFCGVLSQSFSGFSQEELNQLKSLLRKVLAADS